MNRKNIRGIYIWQREDWPNFRWNSEAILEPLSRLNHLHGLLVGKMSMLGLTARNRAQLSAMTEELVTSSEIEGIVLNPNSVRSSIARHLGIEEDGLLVEDHYVEGLVEVMWDAVRNCNSPIDKERLSDWHAALFPNGRSGASKITVADWRKGSEPMQVVSGDMGHEKVHFEAPPSDAVGSEMEKLIGWINGGSLSPYMMAAVVHLWFVTIHPFDDGNGRMSRTLADMMIARQDSQGGRYYSMSAEINRNKREYYDILEATQKGNLDITDWLLWFFSTLEKAICRASGVVERTIQKSEYWERFADIPVNERQRKVLNRLWDGFDGKLTSSKWAKICHCSQDTALRDINDLIAKGMLMNSGEMGRSANYLLPE